MGLFDKLFKKDGAAATPSTPFVETNDAHLITPIDGGEEAHTAVAPAETVDALYSTPALTNADADSEAGAALTEPEAGEDALGTDQPTLRAPIPFPTRTSSTTDAPARQSAPSEPQPVAQMPAPQQQQQQPQSIEELRNNPNFVRVFDQYGQEVFLTREQWRDEVLPQNLQANWDDPEALYAVIVNAMNDGYFAQVEGAAAHLQEIDTNLVRGACVHAIVELQLGRLESAEAILEAYLHQHGSDASVLTNLARIFSDRGETERRDHTLIAALEQDPNAEQALGWSLAIEGENHGEPARRHALEQLAALPNAWRARLWLAKLVLDEKDLDRALTLYREGLATFGDSPVPTEFLYPMSGDLGMAGHLRELLALTEPRFVPEIHGVQVGNNLIKAHVDLGEFEQATELVNRLFRLQRPDFREPLGFWDATVTRARAMAWQEAHPQDPNQPLEIGMLEMTGPVWKRRGGPLEAVFGSKPDSAKLVTILGGTADLIPPQDQNVGMQLADALGRISRTVPLFLAEQIEFNSAAQARALLPRVSQGIGGFVLRGGEWTDTEALDFARGAERVPDLIVKSHVDARQPEWTLTATVLRVADGRSLGTARASFPAGRPELAAPALSAELRLLLTKQGITPENPPAVYQLPDGQFLANYLLRLEQLLAVRTAVASADGPPPLSGEREILDGTFTLAAQLADNPTARALMAQTFTAMERVRPDILDEFEDRLEMLERERPLADPLGKIIHQMTLA